MVSIYSLRPVYTIVYLIINDNVLASFEEKKKSFKILWSKKKIFFALIRNLEPPPPISPLYARVCSWLEKVNVLCNVDRNHERFDVVLNHFKNFKGIS